MPCPVCPKEHTFTDKEALAIFSSTPGKLERALARLTPRRAAARPEPGKWSPKEIVCHLSDCEVVYGFRYRKILAEATPVLPAFDQEVWADGLHYREQSLRDAFATFAALRKGHVALFKSLPDEAWEKGGVHPEYGTLTLRQLIHHLADHDRSHIAQIERLCPPAAAPEKRRPSSKGRARSRR